MPSTKKTLIMGIVNVTPDSFSDGGLYFDSKQAVEHGLKLLKDGADILDIGPESTSYYTDPNKKPVSAHEQIKRAIPVIKELAQAKALISIDTSNAEVAKAALDNGARWINDEKAALGDPFMPMIMKKAEKVILMHGFGLGFGVYEGEQSKYHSVIDELVQFFEQRIASLSLAGVDKTKIIIDPGFGFGKGLNDSLTILDSIDAFKSLGLAILAGPSRKSFIGKLTGIERPLERDFASLAANVMAVMKGASIIRTHQVKMMADARFLTDAV